jgi:hypothetical protein
VGRLYYIKIRQKEELKMEEKTTKIIRNSGVARHLLKAGCTMVDIKPAKEDPTKTKSVFVFLIDDKFNASMEKITNKENTTV